MMPNQLLFGAVADDYTGAADLASMLSGGGVRTALCLSPDAAPTTAGRGYQAVVIALKTRSVPREEACRETLDAAATLRRVGARQIYFKYCSTFDSSSEGNIGPVASALMDAMDVPFTVAVPALPVNGRTQYFGYLFVDDVLLSESHMRHHPVHPMQDANLVRHLQSQTKKRVALIAHRSVRAGASSIRREAERLAEDGVGLALVDVLTEDDLIEIAEAFAGLPLLTGGSGLGWALAHVWKRRGLLLPPPSAGSSMSPGGGVLILSGSCSDATLRQISELQTAHGHGVEMNVSRLLTDPVRELDRLHETIRSAISDRGWALVYSSADAAKRAATVAAAREAGCTRDRLSGTVEAAHRELAARTVAEGGARHLVVAGGETAGAVAEALRLQGLEIEGVLDPGVPLMRPIGGGDLTVTFKSGNFGSPDFFSKALLKLGAVDPENTP